MNIQKRIKQFSLTLSFPQTLAQLAASLPYKIEGGHRGRLMLIQF